MLTIGCAHSFVRPAGDLGGPPDEFAALLYKAQWQKQKVLPVAKHVRLEARVVADQGEQVIEGRVVGGSASQSALLVDLGSGAPTAIPVTALKRMKVTDPRGRDRGLMVHTVVGAASGSLLGVGTGVLVMFFGMILQLGGSEAHDNVFTGTSGFLIGFVPPVVAGASLGLGTGFLRSESQYIVDFTADAWEWEFPEP